MTGSTSKRSLPTCTGFYGTEIKIQIQILVPPGTEYIKNA